MKFLFLCLLLTSCVHRIDLTLRTPPEELDRINETSVRFYQLCADLLNLEMNDLLDKHCVSE